MPNPAQRDGGFGYGAHSEIAGHSKSGGGNLHPPRILKALKINGFFCCRHFVIFGQMIADEIREKLQNIIRGELQKGSTDSCTAIRNLLCQGFGASPTVKSEFESRAIIKEEQVSFLKSYAQKEGLWLKSLPSDSQYLTEGGMGSAVFELKCAGRYPVA